MEALLLTLILCAVSILLCKSATEIVLSNANERIEINFELSYESNSEIEMSPIWQIQKKNVYLLKAWYYQTAFYISTLNRLNDSNYHLITNKLPGNNTFHIQYNKLNESNPIQSNIYCKVMNKEISIQRLIYIDLYPDENYYYEDVNNSNFTDINGTYEDIDIDIDINGTYEIIIFSDDENFQIFDFDISVNEIYTDGYYELIDFEKEYSQMNAVSSNIMIEDFSGQNPLPNAININVSNILNKSQLEPTIEFEFEANRTSQMKIKGSIKQCNFDVIYKEINSSIKNENEFINPGPHGFGLNEFCNYPIPHSFDYTYVTEWLDLYLDEYGVKQQYPKCRDSNHKFWNNKYINMCDTPTAYLKQYDNYNDIFTKVFECNNNNNNNNEWYKWYYDAKQLTILGY
eukprot:156112_1